MGTVLGLVITMYDPPPPYTEPCTEEPKLPTYRSATSLSAITLQPRAPQVDTNFTMLVSNRHTDSNVTPGLECLDVIDSIELQQKVTIEDLLTGQNLRNNYRLIHPDTGYQIGRMLAHHDFCERQLCQENHSFHAVFTDQGGNAIFRLERPLRCPLTCLCLRCGGPECLRCGNKVDVLSARGISIGSVTMDTTCSIPFGSTWFTLRDSVGTPQLRIGNSSCGFIIGDLSEIGLDQVHIHVETMSGTPLERIKYDRGASASAMYLDGYVTRKVFRIPFTGGFVMSPELKATMIAAVVLLKANVWASFLS